MVIYGLLVSHAILLCTACIDINEVSVGIILVGMTIVHILTLRRSFLCAVVNMLDELCELPMSQYDLARNMSYLVSYMNSIVS